MKLNWAGAISAAAGRVSGLMGDAIIRQGDEERDARLNEQREKSTIAADDRREQADIRASDRKRSQSGADRLDPSHPDYYALDAAKRTNAEGRDKEAMGLINAGGTGQFASGQFAIAGDDGKVRTTDKEGNLIGEPIDKNKFEESRMSAPARLKLERERGLISKEESLADLNIARAQKELAMLDKASRSEGVAGTQAKQSKAALESYVRLRTAAERDPANNELAMKVRDASDAYYIAVGKMPEGFKQELDKLKTETESTDANVVTKTTLETLVPRGGNKGAGATLNVGDVKDGLKFTGGNPKRKENWVKAADEEKKQVKGEQEITTESSIRRRMSAEEEIANIKQKLAGDEASFSLMDALKGESLMEQRQKGRSMSGGLGIGERKTLKDRLALLQATGK